MALLFGAFSVLWVRVYICHNGSVNLNYMIIHLIGPLEALSMLWLLYNCLDALLINDCLDCSFCYALNVFLGNQLHSRCRCFYSDVCIIIIIIVMFVEHTNKRRKVTRQYTYTETLKCQTDTHTYKVLTKSTRH